MGKKRAKRVKKAWRNISTDDIDAFNNKATRDANSGGSLASATNDSLFLLDKSTDIPVKRKIEKHREKPLRFESILQRNPFVKPVPSSILKESKKKRKEIAAKSHKQDDAEDKDGKDSEAGLFDIWDSEAANNIKSKKKGKPSLIPPVEVEPPGCSFNPEKESHKDSLALAVAEEMRKVYKSELEPQPIPLIAPGQAIADEDRYFLEVDDEDEEDLEEEIQIETADAGVEKRKAKVERVTKVEHNRRLRRKEQLKLEAQAKKAKEISKEIDSIPDILQEIAQEDEEKQNRHMRRMIGKEERLKSCPPRLGKRKFEPAPVQVLLTEEITGSLRKLKACCTLARDRFKSLEKRGLIVPSARRNRK